MRISQRSIEQVREATNIVEVASEFTALKRQGTNYSGLCPYPDHSEKTPSFSVSPEKGFYYCFGCQKGGDAMKLVMELRNLTFAEAISYLAERSNIEIEFEGSAADSRAAQERNRRRRAVHKALAAATIYYHKYLLKSRSPEAKSARNYLEQRGLNESTIEEFRVGYAPPRGISGFLGAVRKLDLDRRALDAAGLLSARGGERFAGRITFPISDRRGRVVGFGARALGDDHPKYLNSPETEVFNKRDLLYGFPQVAEGIRKERATLVVEGYTDVLMLYQSGIKNAVATLGTATTPAHLRTLSGYADKIYVLFDPDAAGEKAIERAAAAAAELKLDLRVLRLPQDPADWLQDHPAEEFRGLLSGAVPALEYTFRRKAERAYGASAAERSRILDEISELVRTIEDPVFYRDAVRLAAEALGVDAEALRFELGASLDGKGWPSASCTPRKAPRDPLLEAGREVLAMMVANPGLATRALREGVGVPSLPEPLMLGSEDFGDEAQGRIFALLVEYAGEELGAVLSDEHARPLLDEIGALQAAGERLYPSEGALRAAWFRLAALSREREKQALRDRKDLDDEAFYRLHQQLQHETRALKGATAAIEAGGSPS